MHLKNSVFAGTPRREPLRFQGAMSHVKQVEESRISLRLNGATLEANGFPVTTTLLDFIRAHGLTGAKEGCAEGECGACTVAVLKEHGAGCQYVPVNSCLMLLPMAAGLDIYTVEALAQGGKLAEVQQAMVNLGGSQCGYCTPGFVMSMFCEQYRPGRSGPCDIHALGGNLCRCTGYRPIRDAALSLGPASAGALLDRLAHPVATRSAVEYVQNGRQFYRPASLADCLRLLAQHEGARLVAGGTDLVVESNLHERCPFILVSTEGLQELREFAETEDEIRIGAGLTLSEIEARWRQPPSAIQDWLKLFASPLIRNRATLAGNLATASPIGDSAPLLLACDATIEITGVHGTRTVPVASFFHGYRATALTPTEIITAIEIRKPLPEDARFYKVAKRRVDDISTVAACLSVTVDGRNRVEQARFAYGGVAPTPIRAIAAEEATLGLEWNMNTVRKAQEVLARTLKPISDHRGSAEYRVAMAQMLIERYWHEPQTEAAA
jgi:xanthine dehydrogenase small subunit